VGERVREELTNALRRDINDPRVARVLLSRVEMTDDLQLVTALFRLEPDPFALIPEAQAQKAAQAGLRAASGRLRSIVGKKLALRRSPELRFRHDSGQEAEGRVEQLLHEVAQELKKSERQTTETKAPVKADESLPSEAKAPVKADESLPSEAKKPGQEPQGLTPPGRLLAPRRPPQVSPAVSPPHPGSPRVDDREPPGLRWLSFVETAGRQEGGALRGATSLSCSPAGWPS
jgi:ribosome-binding factor A